MSNEDSRRLVNELMISDVITIGPMANLREAMKMMRKHRVKSLVVEKRSGGDAWGILTYTTLLRTIIAEEGDIDLLNVYDIATKPALSVPESLEVRHAVTLMLQFDIKRLLVTSDNELKGILTMNDIVTAILEKLDEDPS
ncbi:CBS domain-containing protein [Wenzhouxiangella sp. AB-CW3]|uniref:CBS domain-containing protein n=1 Tax=Wenzhouxiangella sp. AB-CW3 TaxID=2771012 RepID=UPI00168B5D01|nr:CBS domain-containing protein [Wenzhouxiangella sp. AB-CW3]QOC22981.1 CBS domain-containing protein [Wenzhouxiangella sp. AB-CW3]